MRIYVGADHRGVRYKAAVCRELAQQGHEVVDIGAAGTGPADYPDFAGRVARAVLDGSADRGVLICASGIGMSMAANRFCGIRAALCLTPAMAETARRHNDSNVLCLGQSVTDDQTVIDILDRWLNTEFDGGRHTRRLDKMEGLGSTVREG